MYADNELTAQQRTAVELFLKQNPDLVPELDMFMQIKLEPEEEVTFTGKEALYKTSSAEINSTNYEEFFLLYIDRELSQADSDKVEKFVLQHPQLQDEFTLLKQTVLQPEAITFGDKSSLYRQEDRRRVVPLFSFMRVAVAAAVIGVAVLGWWLYPQQGPTPDGPAVAAKTAPKQQTAIPQVKQDIAPIVTPQAQQDAIKQNTASVNPTPKQQVKAAIPAVNNQKAVNIPAPANNNAVNNDLLAENKQDKPKENVVITTAPEETNTTAANNRQATAKLNTQPNIIDVDVIRQQEMANNADAVAQNNNNVYPVAYKVIDTDEDNKAMYVGSLELNKDKVKGFLKRVFGNKTKRDTEN